MIKFLLKFFRKKPKIQLDQELKKEGWMIIDKDNCSPREKKAMEVLSNLIVCDINRRLVRKSEDFHLDELEVYDDEQFEKLFNESK